MNGVEILSQAEVATNMGFHWGVFWVSVAFVFVIILIMAWKHIDPVDFEDYMCVAVVTVLGTIFIGGLVGALGALTIGEPTEFETQYKVTISDEVQMNKFLEKYEIIDQEGKIYTVREVK